MKSWNFYTAKEIKPKGWLRRQLEIEAEGLVGNLDRVWPDVRDSAWIGGEREGWERVPYWLDGFVPLAYLLSREDMVARAQKYIDAILSRQKENGWICPCQEEEIPHYDSWAVILIAKVLVHYYECSGDARIPDVVYRVMKNYYELLSSGKIKLFEWGEHRWFEAFVALNFLYARYHEDWIVALGTILRAQGTDYTALTGMWHTPKSVWTQDTHIVNIAMMLKFEAVSHALLGEKYTDKAEHLVSLLSLYNGMPTGTFTGDECLSGLSPVQGTELCAVVEQMYSYEWLYAVTGDSKWAERLEMLAFNALPATISEDMWTHQYVQMSNQIACEAFRGRSLFRTNNGEAHLFGLEPNYGCCTANMGQGFPYFALSAFLYDGDTVLSAIPVPATLSTEGYTVALDTAYPFESRFLYTVEAKRDMTLVVRVPSFAKHLSVDGVEVPYTEMLTFSVAKGECRSIRIAYDVPVTILPRPHDLACVKAGSLLFSLPVAYEKKKHEYERDGVLRKFPYCDYEYLPVSPWSYGLTDATLVKEERGVSSVPFSESCPPVIVRGRGAKIAWGYADGFDTVAAPVPQSRLPIGEEEELTLVPYGCAKLRMTELPFI